MRRGVARVITTFCFVVVGIQATKSSVSSLDSDLGLKVGEQRLQQPAQSPATPAQTRVGASFIPDSVVSVVGTRNPALKGGDHDVGASTSWNGRKGGDYTTTVVSTAEMEVPTAGSTLRTTAPMVSYAGGLKLDAGVSTGSSDSEVQDTTLVDTPSTVDASLDNGKSTVHATVKVVEIKADGVSSKRHFVTPTVDSTVTNTIDSTVRSETPMVDSNGHTTRSKLDNSTPTVVRTHYHESNSVDLTVHHDTDTKRSTLSNATSNANDSAMPGSGTAVDSRLKGASMETVTPVTNTIANTTEVTAKSVSSTVPPVFKTGSRDVNKVTSTVPDTATSTVNTVTGTLSGVVKARKSGVDKVTNTVTNTVVAAGSTVPNTIVDPVTPAGETVAKSADSKPNTVTDAASTGVKTTPLADTVTNTISNPVANTGTDKVAPGTVLDSGTNPASTTNTGLTIVSIEGTQTVSNTTAANSPKSTTSSVLTAPTTNDTTMASTTQTSEKQEERTIAGHSNVLSPNATESLGLRNETKDQTDVHASQTDPSSNRDTSTGYEGDGSDSFELTDCPPSSSSLATTLEPLMKSKGTPAPVVPLTSDKNSGSSLKTAGSSDNVSIELLNLMNDPDVGDPPTPEPTRTPVPVKPVARSESPFEAHRADTLTLPAVGPPSNGSSGGRENQLSQEAQARQANEASDKSSSGTSVLLAGIGVAGCVAIVALVAYRKKHEPEATGLDDIRSSITTAEGARGSWDSVYNDPLETRYSSIVMITPNGDGVCIL